MNTTRKQKTFLRLTAALLCLCMSASIIGCFGSISTVALAESTRATEPTEDIVTGTRVADPNTMDDYQNRLLTAEAGSRYAGRVWTDKTVFAHDETKTANTIKLEMSTDGYDGSVGFSSDFAHVFSALASSQVVDEYPPSPIDMVLVLDVSSSMSDMTEPAADSIWAKIFTELESEFAKNEDILDSFKNYYNEHHYHQYRILYNSNGDGTTVSNYKNFEKEEFPAEDLFNRGSGIKDDGTIFDKSIADEFLARYQVGGYIKRRTSDQNWEYTPDPPPDGTISNSEYRKIVGIEISKDSDFWTSDGTEYTIEQAAARQALVHTRFLNLIYSANRVIDELMKNNPENRVSVVIYDRRATVIMPLAHYVANTQTLEQIGSKCYDNESNRLNDSTTDLALKIIHKHLKGELYGYLCPYFDGHGSTTGHPTGYVSVNVARVLATPKAGETDNDGNPVKTTDIENIRLAGTNTHAGLTAGLEQLANAKETTLTAKLSNGEESTVPRIPVAVVMTDGGSNTVANGPWYDPDYATPVQRSDYKNEWSSVVVTQYLLTAAYLKSAVEKNYSAYMNLKAGQDVPVYTVGVDLRDDSDEWVPARLYPMMDPATYFVEETKVPGKAGNPSASSGQIDLADDSGNDKRSNEGIIGKAYQNWKDWQAKDAEDITMLFPVLHWGSDGKGGKIAKQRFQQDEAEEGYEYNSYIIPFEQDAVNMNGLFGSARLVEGKMTYNNGPTTATVVAQYNQDWHGWQKAVAEGVLDKEKWKEKNTDIFKKDYDDDALGTATFWTFANAQKTLTSKYTAGNNTYRADYLEERNVTYKDTVDGTGIEKERIVAAVTMEDMQSNINYVTKFYDVSTSELDGIFEEILEEILGEVFVPVSGDNDAGVGDSITYQDPLGEYMEIKNAAIKATPHHIDGGATHQGEETTYDMALLVFGEMHGLVRAGVYDWNWNDQWMIIHKASDRGITAFSQGWYKGTPDEAADTPLSGEYLTTDAAGTWPNQDPNTKKTYTSAQEARDDGWVMRFNFETLLSFVPITGVDGTNPNVHPSALPDQVKNTVYTCYRFAGTQKDRNALHRNPIYGDVPDELKTKWNAHETAGSYPVGDEEYAGTPGVYRLSDIRVWVEEYGDYKDTDGAITPNQGYDRSLYVNIPAAAVPTELATITLGADGVMAYQTNLGKDHPDGTNIGEKNEVTYKEYCYQSTPFRLFYAVGLEDDLINRDGAGNQNGVNFDAISPEYIQSHTEGQNVWFISNFYSNTRYGEYTTENTSHTRGDPTVSFSPSIDNRYYVFQKPLPLYAHAYRVGSDDKLHPVDAPDSYEWPNNRGGNGETTWEDGAKGGASWTGGQYMGTYDSIQAFNDAPKQKDSDNKTYITDSNNIKYEYVENGIVFLREDLLEHVTSNPDSEGGGYTGESISFSSDDYFFILLEFYVPEPGTTGTERDGKEIDGATGGKLVQYALARKGSEFGSGFVSQDINNGDMLCWTDMNRLIDAEFLYMSMSDTGDLTRGEPTFEKLTKTDSDLESYLRDTCKIKSDMIPNPYYVSATETPGEDEEISILDYQVRYWTSMQADPQVKAALKAAAKDEDRMPREDEFNAYFRFAVATRPGGIRSGDMSNNLQYKGTSYDTATQLYNNNTTKTSNTYYLPTVSDNSGTDNNIIINNYLGNNGRMAIANDAVHVTKMVSLTGTKLTDEQKSEEFNFQVYLQGISGTRTAVRTEYNEYVGTDGAWERELAYIDVLTDNSDLVQTNNNTRALFVKGTADSSLEGGTTTIARQVIRGDNGKYYYADDKGAQGDTEVDAKVANELYYLYLPNNAKDEETQQHVHRLYQATDYNGADKDDFDSDKLAKNGRTTFVNEGQHEITGIEPGKGNQDSYRLADETKGRPAGTKTYWSQDAELIPVSEVTAAETSNEIMEGVSGIALESTESSGQWTHTSGNHDEHVSLAFHTFVIRKPGDTTSATNFTSPYLTRTQYFTIPLEFDAAYTAKFTLQHGHGLLLTGLQGNQEYRFTETLTPDQIANGYTLQEIEVRESATGKPIPSTPTTNTGVYSVSGTTNSFEQQVNYINTVVLGDIAITKVLNEADGKPATSEEDKESKFSFTLELQPTPATGWNLKYTLTGPGAEDKISDVPMPTTQGGSDANGITLKDDNTWSFTLKGGQTLTVEGLPSGTEYTYTATENDPGAGYVVTDSSTTDSITDRVVTGKIDKTKPGAVSVTFTNTKKKPTATPVTINLTKNVTGEGFSWKGQTFTFLVTPDSENNPADDPIQSTSNTNWDASLKAMKVKISEQNASPNIFAGLEFTTPGTYKYIVTEQPGDISGMTYDNTQYTVEVVVAEEYKENLYTGNLTATVKVNNKAETNSLSFNNTYTYPKGSLTISKTVEGTDEDKNKEFNFTVTLDDKTINGTFGGMMFTDGVATFTLKHGESKTAEGLPAGVGYTVTETEANKDGYVTSMTDNVGTPTNGEGTIDTNGTDTVEFTNEKLGPGEFVPRVEKAISGIPKVGEVFTFTLTAINGAPMPTSAETVTTTVTVTATGSGTGSFGPITYTEAGTYSYTITETGSSSNDFINDTSTWTLTVTVSEVGGKLVATGVYSKDGATGVTSTEAATFTNIRKTGKLTVTKTVSGTGGDTTKAFTFTVKLDDTSISGTYGDMTFTNGVATFTLKHGESKTATGLPAGVTYTVTEEKADGYTATIEDGDSTTTDGKGTIEGDETDEVTVANTYTPTLGSLTITKKIADNTPTEATNKTYTFTVTGPDDDKTEREVTVKGNGSATLNNLVPGTYTIEEKDGGIEGYKLDVKVEGNATVTAGGTAEITVTNTYTQLGSLTVTKIVIGDGADKSKPFSFTVTLDDETISGTYGDMTFANGVATFTLTDGGSKTATGLPAGVGYSVTETEANAGGYITTIEDNDSTSTDGKGTIEGDKTDTVTVTNKHVPGPEKTEVTPGAGKTVKAGDEITYKITWANDQNGEATVVVEDPLDAGVDYVSSEPGGIYNAAAHTVTWSFADQAPGAEGEVTLTVKVNEKAFMHWQYQESSDVIDDDTDISPDYEVVDRASVQVGNEPKVYTDTIQNPVEPGALTVTKTVAGAGADKSKAFEFTVKLTPPDGARFTKDIMLNGITDDYDGEIAVTGDSESLTYSFTLSDGQQLKLGNIPVGTTYTVTEKPADGYSASVGIAGGTVGENGRTAHGEIPAGDVLIPYENTRLPGPEKTETDPGDRKMVAVGQEITYRITWINDKSAEAEVTVADKLDPGVDFVSADNGGAYDAASHTVTWSLGKQKSGASGSVTLKVRANEKAFDKWTYNDPPTDGTSSAGKDHEVWNQAGVRVDNDWTYTNKVENPVPEKEETTPGAGEDVKVGDEITYRIHWKNGYDVPATVTVKDPLDKGVDFVSADNGGKYDPAAHAVTWTLPDRPAGAEGFVTLTVRVNAQAVVKEEVENQASVKVGNDDEVWTQRIPNPLGPSKVETHVNDRDVSGELTKSGRDVTGPTVKLNDTITYKITWVNDAYDAETGELTAATVKVTDPLDKGVDFVSADNNGQYDAASHTVTWNLGEQAAGASGSVTLTVRVNANAVTHWAYGPETADNPDAPVTDETMDYEVVDRAYVEVGNGPKVYTDTIHNPLEPGSLTVTKTVRKDGIDVQDDETQFAFTIELTAPGDVKFNYTGEKAVTWTVSAGVNVERSGDTLTFKLRHGESVTVTNLPEGTAYKVTEAPAVGYAANPASLEGTIASATEAKAAFVNALLPENEKTETHVNDRDVSGELTRDGTNVTGPTVKVGDTITYRITWVNDRGETANVTVSDPLDKGADYVSSEPQGKYDEATHTVTWSLGEQESGANGFMTLTVRVNEKAFRSWRYGEADEPTVDDSALDFEVVDRAKVSLRLANGSEHHAYTDTIHNPLTPGGLTVRKAVAGNGGETEVAFNFRVELSDKALSGAFGGMTFKEGVAEFTLKHGQSVTASGLPAGVGYEVTEAEANLNGYETAATGAKGAIPEGETALADFVNRRVLPEVPHTGDDGRPGLWAALACVSAVCILLLRRRKQGES